MTAQLIITILFLFGCLLWLYSVYYIILYIYDNFLILVFYTTLSREETEPAVFVAAVVFFRFVLFLIPNAFFFFLYPVPIYYVYWKLLDRKLVFIKYKNITDTMHVLCIILANYNIYIYKYYTWPDKYMYIRLYTELPIDY